MLPFQYLQLSASQTHKLPSQSNQKPIPHQSRHKNHSTQKHIFPFLIFLSEKLLQRYNNQELLLQQIKQNTKVESISFNPSYQIQQIVGRTVQIKDESLKKRSETLDFLLQKIIQSNYYFQNMMIISIFIPEYCFGLLLGYHRTNLNRIKEIYKDVDIRFEKESATNKYKHIRLRGKKDSLVNCCSHIYQYIERNKINQKSKGPKRNKYEDQNGGVVIQTQLIVEYEFVSYLQTELKSGIQLLKAQTFSKIQFLINNQQHKTNTMIARIRSPTIEQLYNFTCILINFMENFENDRDYKKHTKLTMLIPYYAAKEAQYDQQQLIQYIKLRSQGETTLKLKFRPIDKLNHKKKISKVSISGTKSEKMDAFYFIMSIIQCDNFNNLTKQTAKDIITKFKELENEQQEPERQRSRHNKSCSGSDKSYRSDIPGKKRKYHHTASQTLDDNAFKLLNQSKKFEFKASCMI